MRNGFGVTDAIEPKYSAVWKKNECARSKPYFLVFSVT